MTRSAKGSRERDREGPEATTTIVTDVVISVEVVDVVSAVAADDAADVVGVPVGRYL